MAAAADHDEIEEVNANYTLMANLQQALTSGTQTDRAPVYDSDGSAKVHDYENYDDNEIFNMFTQEEQYTELLEPNPEQYQNLAIEVEKVITVNRMLKETNADLTTELARFKNQEKCFEISQEKYDKLERCYQQSVYQEQCLSKKINALHLSTDNTKTRRPQPRSNTKNDRVPSASKSSRSKNKEAEVEEHHRNLLLSKNNKHISSACNNIKIDSQNVISKVVCAICKQCLISVNHDISLRNYVNGKSSRGFIERLATPKLRKPRFLLRWSPTGRLFDQKGKLVDSSESESQSDCSNGDNACTSNTLEPKIKRFLNSTSLLG
nr:hypothetical protein [Tanacetum cinerariifolium]